MQEKARFMRAHLEEVCQQLDQPKESVQTWRTWRLVAAALPLVTALFACGSSTSDTSPAPTSDAGTDGSSDANPEAQPDSPDAPSGDAAADSIEGGVATGELLLQGGAGEHVVPHTAVRSDGTTWLAWYAATGAGAKYSLRLQRFDTAGGKKLGADGVLASSVDSDSWVMDYTLLADSTGDAILVYSNTTDFTLHAQRFDAQGQPAWGANGATVYSAGAQTLAPRAVLCTDGNVALAWDAADADSGMGTGIQLQRLDGTGTAAWSSPKQIPGDAGNRAQSPRVVASLGGDFVVVWIENGGVNYPGDAFAQRFNTQGNPVWQSKVKLNDADQLPFPHVPVVDSDGAGGLYAAWMTVGSGSMFAGHVQHFAADGAAAWAPGGVSVSTSTTMSHLPSALASSQNQVFVAWKETDSNQNTSGLYAQTFDQQGTAMWAATGLPIVEADNQLGALAAAARPTGEGAALFYAYGEPNTQGLRSGVSAIPYVGSPSPSNTVLSDVVSAKGHPDVSALVQGGYWLVWEDERSGNPEIWGAWWKAP
jgi:hypothetical protein